MAKTPVSRWRVQYDDLSDKYLVLSNDPPCVIAEALNEPVAMMIAESHNHMRSLLDTVKMTLGGEVHGWTNMGALGMRRQNDTLLARVLHHPKENAYSAMILRLLPDGAVQVLHHQPPKANGTLAICEANAWLQNPNLRG
jgi:hypothetical protein